MDAATLNAGRTPRQVGLIRKIVTRLFGWTNDLSVTEKVYGIAAGLVVVTIVLMVMSTQSLRLQTGHRHLLASSA